MVADAAQGLCPNCLMAVGIGTQPEPEGAASKTPPPRPEELAAHFPQLEILEVIGQGGMGVVYRARQRKLDRVVALKVLSRDAAKDPAFSERFNREARALARLNHPNIVTVHDFGEADGWFYLVMEYVDGADLRRVLQQGRLSPEEALRIVPVVCDALQYAHANGVVHRDIKPGNILMDRESRVKIADFGIAKLAGQTSADVTLTQSKQSMGTPHYMAPEQVESPLTVDHRADIYSLGVVFYEMLTGELPLGRFAPPSRRVQVDVRLDDVVLRALEKEPDRRYQQVGEVKTEVEKITGRGDRGKRESVGDRIKVRLPFGVRTWLGLGVAWAVLSVATFRVVQTHPGLVGTEAPGLMLWILAYLGALAPLGTTVFGWLAIREADLQRCGAKALSSSLGVMVLPMVLVVGLVGCGLAVTFLFEVLRVPPGGFALFIAVVAYLLVLGWLSYRARRWVLSVLALESKARPAWFPWLSAGPLVIGLMASLLMIRLATRQHSAWSQRTQVSIRDLMRAGVPPVNVSPVHGIGITNVVELAPGSSSRQFPLLGQGSMTPSDPFLDQLSAPRWTMSPSGPVLADELATQVLGTANPLKRATLDRALQSAWTEYRDALRSHLERTTNSAGHVVIEVRSMATVLEAISNRFWTAVDAELDVNQQVLMRAEFGPQFRPRWVATSRGRFYVTTRTLLRFGEHPFFLEFWREGAWYRHRAMEGNTSLGELAGVPEQHAPALPEDQQILIELTETSGTER
jgi:serine/threonine protein kinase